ncbi:cyanophycinase [Mariniflexile sp.]|uniref:cyanophycinase n=1 Tax=Mariniflexile sp. TaxID=1979402 RepID=UPI004048AAC1
MKKILFICFIALVSCSSNSESNEETVIDDNPTSKPYTNFITGNKTDVVTNPLGGTCLMGGSTENDEAMKWFLKRANGGDVLILRASGSDGYNEYMYRRLGVSLNSVETIVVKNASASNDAYIQDKIKKAEAIWFAGGDQWNYISFWRDTPIATLINDAISKRKIAIGGTSAGMAILGGYYYSAKKGTVTSETALNNPYHANVTVENTPFLKNEYLSNVITDTHYDNPNRKGRHVAFLARILKDFGKSATGIACDESTSVCIDENGLAKVFGMYPTFDDNAYFISVNNDLPNNSPEIISPNNPLTWNLGGKAIKVYKVKGTNTGDNTFDLTNWNIGNGGEWLYWYVEKGVLHD